MNKLTQITLAAAFLVGSLAVPLNAEAEGWGNLKGKITFDGEIKTLPPLVKKGAAVADPAICAAQDVASEELLIDPKSKGIANCIIWVKRKPRKIHPSLEKSAKPIVKVDNIKCVFTPHVFVVRTDQTLNAVNSDACSHNVKTNFIFHKNENPILVGNDQVGASMTFKKSELLPMPIQCSIHAWMKAYCFVIDNPYFAMTDKDGNFEIKNLPAGKHTFIVWQEKGGYLNNRLKVKIEDGKTAEENMSFKEENFEDE